jgi:hypothetical protein
MAANAPKFGSSKYPHTIAIAAIFAVVGRKKIVLNISLCILFLTLLINSAIKVASIRFIATEIVTKNNVFPKLLIKTGSLNKLI